MQTHNPSVQMPPKQVEAVTQVPPMPEQGMLGSEDAEVVA